MTSLGDKVSVDDLAQIIRRVDGDNSLGAGALAEAILAALDISPPVVEEGARPLGPHTEEERMCFARGMEQWRASLKRSDLTEEDRVKGALDAYCRQAFALSLPLASPVPEPQAVAWRYRYEETGEDNEMIWSDWIVVKWKPNRSVFSTKVEIEPLAPLSGGGGKVTDEAIDRAIKAYCDEPSNDMRDMMRAALATMGGK